MELYLTQYQQFLSWLLTDNGKRYFQSKLAALNIQLKAERGNHLLMISSEDLGAIKTQFLHCKIQKFESLAKKFPYADKSFDGIILSHILAYVSQPALILQEALRLLQPNGLLLVNDFTKSLAINDITKQLRKLGFNEICCKRFSADPWRRYCPCLAEAYTLKARYCCYGLPPVKRQLRDVPLNFTKESLAL